MPRASKFPPAAPRAAEVPLEYTEPLPEIREPMATLELVDVDFVEERVRPAPRSAPPPPPHRSVAKTGAAVLRAVPSSVPVVPSRAAVVTPPPDSHTQLTQTPVQTLAPVQTFTLLETATTVQAFTPVHARTSVASGTPLRAFAPVKTKFESMLDPSESLFVGMAELTYADSHWTAARLCAAALGRALGARTVIVHAHDLATRQLKTIGVHGEGEFELLGSADASDDDLVASAVICNQKAVTMRFDGELPRLAPKRLGRIAVPRTLVAVPVMAWGRCVALIEIIDAEERFANQVADSASYVACRLAEFLSERAAA